MKNKIIFLSCSDIVTQTNVSKMITKCILEDRKSALKFISADESLKNDLNDLCLQRIGISPFTLDSFELKLLSPFLRSYRNVLLSMDAYFWKERSEKYINKLLESVPKAVQFFVTDFNYPDLFEIDLGLEYKPKLIRFEGASKKVENEDFLNLVEFQKANKNRNYHLFNFYNDKNLLTEDDIPDNLKDQTNKMLNEILNGS